MSPKPRSVRSRSAHADTREFGATQRAGETHQQQRAVAQPGHAAGRIGVGRDRRQQLAQHGQGGRPLLRGVGRIAADAGEGFGHVGVLGWRGNAGSAVQEADGGATQVERVGGEAAVAFVGQEGGHVERRGGQGGQPVLGAPAAPGAHGRTIGFSRIVGLGAAAIGACRAVGGGEAAIVLRFRGGSGGVEPGSDQGRVLSDGRLVPTMDVVNPLWQRPHRDPWAVLRVRRAGICDRRGGDGAHGRHCFVGVVPAPGCRPGYRKADRVSHGRRLWPRCVASV